MKNKNKAIMTTKTIELLSYIILQVVSYIISLKLDLFSGYDIRNYQAFYDTIPMVLFFSIVLIFYFKLLKTVNKSYLENVLLIGVYVIAINTFYMAIAFFGRDFAMPRTVILLGAIIQFFLFLMIKFSFIAIVKATKRERNIALFCPEQFKETLVIKVLSSHVHKECLTYCVDPDMRDDYMNYVDKSDKIYIADSLSSVVKDKIVSHCISMDKSLYMIPKTFEIAIFNSSLIQISDVPVFKVESLYLSEEKLMVKRLFDFVFSLFALIALSPIMLLVALVLLFTQGRPILFTQERVTKDNKVFKLYKFRSMGVDAEKDTGPVWASENDQRVTKVGRFLRRYWLDELPQFFNVLKGDMSLVGPRPERPVFIDEFAKDIPDFRYRLSVKAGVTGLAQVLGRYATTPDLKIKYDLLYIKNSSLLYDIKIVFETIKKIIIGTLRRGESIELDYYAILKKNGYIEKLERGVTRYKKKNSSHTI